MDTNQNKFYTLSGPEVAKAVNASVQDVSLMIAVVHPPRNALAYVELTEIVRKRIAPHFTPPNPKASNPQGLEG